MLFRSAHSCYNRAEALTRAADDEELLAQIIDIFITETPALLEQMDGFFQSGDHQRIFRTAHTIKGSSSNLSAAGVSNAAREVELPARSGDLAAAAAALPALKASTAALIAELALEQNNHSSAGLCGATP